MKKVLFLLLSAMTISLLSGCYNNLVSLPDGFFSSDQTTAEEYMTNNPLLIEKYGADYTFSFHSGSGIGEKNWKGYSGEMEFEYLVNETDRCAVSLSKKKHENWEVTGFLLKSANYECKEVNLTFGQRIYDDDHRYDANGILEVNGQEIPVIVGMTCRTLRVEDVVMRQEYQKAWQKLSEDEFFNMNLEERQKWQNKEKACTIFSCSVEPQFDSFVATIYPDYEGILGNNIKVLHFSAVQESP